MLAGPLAISSERIESESPTPDEGSAEEIRTLRDRTANCDSSSAGSLSCKLRRRSVFVFDQVLSAGEKVVNRVLLGQLSSGIMPIFAVLSAAAYVCDRKNSTPF